MKTLVSFAPVIVLVYANPGFQHYKSGIYSGCPNFNTSVKNINHAVLLIGYD
jgi:C1A family cysteine protease